MAMTADQKRKKNLAREEAMIDSAYRTVENMRMKPRAKDSKPNDRKQTANNPEGYETSGYAI
jgi:hypothetical protein